MRLSRKYLRRLVREGKATENPVLHRTLVRKPIGTPVVIVNRGDERRDSYVATPADVLRIAGGGDLDFAPYRKLHGDTPRPESVGPWVFVEREAFHNGVWWRILETNGRRVVVETMARVDGGRTVFTPQRQIRFDEARAQARAFFRGRDFVLHP